MEKVEMESLISKVLGKCDVIYTSRENYSEIVELDLPNKDGKKAFDILDEYQEINKFKWGITMCGQSCLMLQQY